MQSKKQGPGSYIFRHKVVSIVIGHVVVMGVLVAILLGNTFGTHVFGAFAFASCPNGDKTYAVRSGDTLGSIATRNNMSWQSLASHNKLANPNMLFMNQNLCIPAGAKAVSMDVPPKSDMSSLRNAQQFASSAKGIVNAFAYGQCTWWADERYRELHGAYVPWRTNANASQWVNRAQEANWRVSARPVQGAIIVLQPGVQGAWGAGHVGVVEKVLDNSHVVASNMNWGSAHGQVIDVQFSSGPGVSFLSSY